MTTWFTSDTHFGHKNIIKYSNRPFSNTNEMNEVLIESWNFRVKPDDTIWHLGDFAFMTIEQIEHLLTRLNGRKNFIYGNHDQALLGSKRVLNTYFEWHGPYKEIKLQSGDSGLIDIVLCHFPILTWNKGHYGAWMLHGHCHGTTLHPWGGKIQDVGTDPMGYKPVSFEELLPMMATRKFSKHHETTAAR